jgi:hypothetical protein
MTNPRELAADLRRTAALAPAVTPDHVVAYLLRGDVDQIAAALEKGADAIEALIDYCDRVDQGGDVTPTWNRLFELREGLAISERLAKGRKC